MTAVERRIKRAERRRLCEESEGENVWNGGGEWKGRGCVVEGRGKMCGMEGASGKEDEVVW